MNAGSIFAILIVTTEVLAHVEVQNIKFISFLICDVIVFVQA
jgi:hypothetical protein